MAGIFSSLFHSYSKPGRGVRKDEPRGSRFVYFWKLTARKIGRLIQLNLLYLLFCLPVVTIGAATAGLMYILRNMANEQPVFLISDFWDAFRQNWKHSSLYFLLTALLSVLIAVSVQFYLANTALYQWMVFPAALSMFAGLMIVLMSFYMYLMIVTLDLPFRAMLRNAAIFSIIRLKANLITLFFLLLILAPVFCFPVIGLLLILLIVPAFAGFMICYNVYPGIREFIIEPYLEAQQASHDPETAERLFTDDGPA